MYKAFYVCDKCGKEIEHGNATHLTIKARSEEDFDSHLDLCPQCDKEFEKWLKEKQNDRKVMEWLFPRRESRSQSNREGTEVS